MKPDCRDALSLALERGIAGEPGNGLWRYYNASPLSGLSEDWKNSLVCAQEFRPSYLALKQNGYTTFDDMEEKLPSKGGMFLLGKDRKWNEFQLAHLWNRFGEGARILVAGDKKGGIQSIRKWFGEHAEITDSFSKFHSVVFWADKKHANQDLPHLEIVRQSEDYFIADGVFSSNGPDKGSKLLVEHFDNRIGGRVADLGAGWGYLSGELLKRTSKKIDLHLFEADRHALKLAEKSLGRQIGQGEHFHWIDVTTEFPKKPYNWVIMNPPFHLGRASEPDLGKRFIEVAASTLPSGGRLLMVANRNLPYEKTLEAKFKRFEKLSERDGFKVFEAIK